MVTQTMGPAGWFLYVDKELVASNVTRTNGENYIGTRSLQIGGYADFDRSPNHWPPADDPVGSHYFRGYIDEAAYFDNKQPTAARISEYVDAMWQQSANAKVLGVVDPIFSMSVAGRTTTCNGETPTGEVTSTSTAVAFGSTDATAQKVGAQDLTVSSNAGNGWSIYTRSTGPMSGRPGHTIANVSGSNATPGAFPAAGSEGFGYTTSDTALLTGTASRFFSGTTQWAAPSTSNELIADETGPTEVTRCVAYRLGISALTPADTYSTQITYTVVPRF